MTKPWDAASERLLRELAPQVLGAVARRFRDFSSAEDAVQEAMIAAFTQWPQEGVPENPRGWLIQVAFRRMADRVRSEIARRQRETAVAKDAETMAPVDEIESDMDPDDTLILLFMCCHPALTSSSAIALTLRAVPRKPGKPDSAFALTPSSNGWLRPNQKVVYVTISQPGHPLAESISSPRQ